MIKRVLFIFLMCFPLHFLYELLPCYLTSVIAPVNESIWEHMKLFFTANILWMFWDYFKTKKLKSGDNFLTAILSIIIFLAIYLPVQALLGEVFIITLIIMFIAICFSVYFSSRFFKFDKNNLKYFGMLLIVISYFSFSYLTYNPPKGELFIDKTNNTYGITKKRS